MKRVLCSLSSLLLVSLTTCKAIEAEGAPPAPSRAPADRPVEAPTAAADPVIGTWSLDSAATVAEMFGSSSATLTLAADHTVQGTMSTPDMLSGRPKETNMSGTWTSDGSTITTTADGDSKEEVQTLTIDGDRLNVLVDQGGQQFALVFVRGR